ncbi:Lrp/AsnC family transcriptional regulator [Chromobacterium subtsugae]|uniref:Lrp/AsnC family transcriptional regulator n=1 Tax=Chromobacterium subtsugae TaxID=251747 RepID=A0ABS7F8A1_9NEIS|nr:MULTISPECIES: Lrp/AsnC family transcriptional regulator [Chromobacterium]KUM03086.1 AsnC family transcriptional regulator [Chromobacterium subtsugae]KZE86165.1 AsnC family transcriptional regulator [Chromobacterium sp. F49]MBW7568820.1 Lrp/AsnC family transcriptional regulator [Chromobacterium subtsugae]MBW8286021.1 Lrp/AsnC family transcriptional regulator [Chromobacterium subtsugae]WSE91922.1 Lrp/AsnC family transcriptional regulator [Chromobacterium subtsugae]
MRDWIDVELVKLLQQNARQSLAELARRLKMAGPSVSERLKRLEESGAIAGYAPTVNPEAWGYTLTALVRLRPFPGQLKTLEARLIATPQVIECDKVTGEDCFIARLALRHIRELDDILDQLSELASTTSSIVKNSPVQRRLPPLQPRD